jgi:hypothetical protein
MEPHPRKLPLRLGGVMRCCIETLSTTPVTEEEGEILKCKWCSSSLIVRNGVWEWNQEFKSEYQQEPPEEESE